MDEKYIKLVSFNDSPDGRIAWHLWKNMSEEKRKKTGLTNPTKLGQTIFVMPGLLVTILCSDGSVVCSDGSPKSRLGLFQRAKIYLFGNRIQTKMDKDLLSIKKTKKEK